jgi:coenzyme F420-reducing hydrogenase beta subunit
MEKSYPGRTAGFPRRKFGGQEIRKYLGEFRQTFFAYAADPVFREKAASGGTVSALLAFLLGRGKIDGALVCRSEIMEGRVRPRFLIARTSGEVMSAQGSKYIAVDFNRDALPLIRQFEGRLAVAALPCDTSSLRRACEREGDLAGKIALVITLFCGHNSRPELTDMVADKLTPPGARLTAFDYRLGHWRGSLRAEFTDGQIVHKPFSVFSNYQNLYFFSQQKCHHCHDHAGYGSDISAGDIWSARMKKEPIKHSAVIIRTETGQAFFQEAMDAGVLSAYPVPPADICDGQARGLPFHYNISARAKAGRLLGMHIKDSVAERVRWNDFLAAWMALANEEFSRSARGQRIIRHLPQSLLRFYLLVMKGLESF